MAIWNRDTKSSEDSSSPHSDPMYAQPGKAEYHHDYSQDQHAIARREDGGAAPPEEQRLHRGLKARHITMIAIGGAIGTGLIIGTGKALAQAG
jgi:yeast amino acid transporter